MFARTRFRISAAALIVKVMATISSALTPRRGAGCRATTYPLNYRRRRCAISLPRTTVLDMDDAAISQSFGAHVQHNVRARLQPVGVIGAYAHNCSSAAEVFDPLNRVDEIGVNTHQHRPMQIAR